MSRPVSARIVSVSGGSESLAVRHREVLDLSAHFDDVAGSLATMSERTAAVLGDVHLLESATLAPLSCAQVEGALALLASATLACAATWEGAAFGSRELVRTLQLADLESAATMHGIDQLIASAVLADPVAAAPVLMLDPPLLQHVVDGLPSLAIAAALGGWSESGVRVVPGIRTCGLTPRTVADLMQRLSEVSALPDGTIDVQTHELADGRRVHVVYLPGTDQIWSDGFTGDVRDLKENGRLLNDEPTAHAVGIEKALDLAGVAPGEKVLLVGHSQGGMQAAQLLAHGSGYDVTNVVTAGSPIAHAGAFPAGSHVLSLENRADFVPDLDGADNPATPQHVTVTFSDGPDTPVGSHGMSHYVDGAAAVDAATDVSVRDSVASLQPFFAPGRVTSQLFVMTRDVSHP